MVNPREGSRTVSQKAVTGRRVSVFALIFIVVAALLAGRLFWVQVIKGPELREQAEQQRTRVYVEPARRGEIVDREGNQLAYTMQARSLTVSPKLLREELRQQQELQMRIDGVSKADIEAQIDARVEDVLRTMANEIPGMIGDGDGDSDGHSDGNGNAAQSEPDASGELTRTVGQVSAKEILDKLHADTNYEVLVRLSLIHI